MINFSFSKAGREWNEDRAYSCEDFAFVLDGATCLNGEHFSSFGSDAEWYANWWYEYLKIELKDISRTIPKILKDGIKKVVKDYKKLAKGETPEDFPAATFSAIRRIDGRIEMYSLCDTSLIFLSKNGEVLYIQDASNCVNDGFNTIIINAYAKKENISRLEARKKYADVIRHGRKYLKNQPCGYHVLADSVDAIDFGIYNSIDESLIDKVLIMSDGFSQVFDVIKFMTQEQLIKKINSLYDAEKIYNRLYKLQELDKDCRKYPRFKVRDDASIAFMKF